MIDYSFIRLKDNITDALNIGDSPIVTHKFFSPIQLLPSLTYTQITNFTGGIALQSDVEVFIVDCNDNVLADITDNVFIEDFTNTSTGESQCKIEYVNLGVDFYRDTVLIRFNQLSSDAVYWSNPINITEYQCERTVFFKYKNYDNYQGIGYTDANVWQSISLAMYFDIPIDETETEDYFQISRNVTISSRSLIKVFKQYKIEQINTFTFERLNMLLKHDLIYMDNIRVTNKPTVSSEERQGNSNVFESSLTVAKNPNDVSPYEFQVFEGLELSLYNPFGLYVTGYQIEALSVDANVPLTLNEGNLSVYKSDSTLIHTFTESDMVIQSDNQLKVISTGTTVEFLPNESYYVTLTAGIVSGLGSFNTAIEDDTTWTFTLSAPDFDGDDFNNNDFFTD